MKSTGIQWCDDTRNPTMGCSGCELWNAARKTCYAGTLHQRFGGVTKGYAPTFEQVTKFPGRMEEILRWKDLTNTERPDKPWIPKELPRLIFVSDMSDALSASIDFEYLKEEIVDVAMKVPHQFLWLTKRPGRMAEFTKWLDCPLPENIWVGTSITTQATTPRLDDLLRVGHNKTIRFVSLEPQWEDVDLEKWLPNLNWIIQGGESGPRAIPFDISWSVRTLRQCRKHNVPYFLKQLGSKVKVGSYRLTFDDAHAGDWDEWKNIPMGSSIRVREFPNRSMITRN